MSERNITVSSVSSVNFRKIRGCVKVREEISVNSGKAGRGRVGNGKNGVARYKQADRGWVSGRKEISAYSGKISRGRVGHGKRGLARRKHVTVTSNNNNNNNKRKRRRREDRERSKNKNKNFKRRRRESPLSYIALHREKRNKNFKARSRTGKKMNSGQREDKGWSFQGRKKKRGNKYSVRDFLKLREKEIKAERIEEEEEKTSEASAGARTGVSDLVPTLNLTEDDPIEVSDTEDEVAVGATGGEIDEDGGEEEEGDEAQGSGGKADIHDGQGSDEEEKGGGEEEGEKTEEEMDTLRGTTRQTRKC